MKMRIYMHVYIHKRNNAKLDIQNGRTVSRAHLASNLMPVSYYHTNISTHFYYVECLSSSHFEWS